MHCEELEKVNVRSNEDKYFQVKTQLPLAEKEELLVFLRDNLDVFVWSAYEVLNVDLEFIYHPLNVNSVVMLKRQPPQCSSKEHAKVVNKLKQAGAIKDAFYPKWLANTVVVKKK